MTPSLDTIKGFNENQAHHAVAVILKTIVQQILAIVA